MDENGEVAELLCSILLRLDNLERFATYFDLVMSGVYAVMENTNENLKGFSAAVMGLLRGWGFMPAADIPLVDEETVGAIGPLSL
ncbi:hypothetical protein F5Y16DRAFT_40496 [Xylariaceae sp. FL0255]|nr:hypothetical protein F5Y16DRAFT_40496 [Xylariaceae sp. FL0255]